MKRLIFNMIFVFCTLTLNAQSSYHEPDLYSIINRLLKQEYRDIGLVAIELDKASKIRAYFVDSEGDTVEMDPPPPPPVPPPPYFSYDKNLFTNICQEGILNSSEVEYMFQQVDSIQNFLLDSSKIDCKTFRFQEILKIFQDKGTKDGYEAMVKIYSKIGYMKLTSPVFSFKKDKVLLSLAAFKSGSWTTVSYLFSKINNNWEIVYSTFEY